MPPAPVGPAPRVGRPRGRRGTGRGCWNVSLAMGSRQVALDWRAGVTRVHGYPMRLTQALDNLVANAVEHGRGPRDRHGAHEWQPGIGLRARSRGRPDAATPRRSPALLAGAPRSRAGCRAPRRRVARRHPAPGPGSVGLGDRGPAAGGRAGRLWKLPARPPFPTGRAPALPRRDAAPPRRRHARRVGDLRRPGRFGGGPLRGRDRIGVGPLVPSSWPRATFLAGPPSPRLASASLAERQVPQRFAPPGALAARADVVASKLLPP